MRPLEHLHRHHLDYLPLHQLDATMEILLAVDLDEPASFTQQATRLARRLDATLLVLHVFNTDAAAMTPDQFPVVGGFQPYDTYDPHLAENLREAEEDAFHAFLTERFDGTVRAAIQQGTPASVILDDADQMDVDLIVLGKRRHSALERFFVGSVASQVVKRTHRPTLLLPVEDDEDVQTEL